MEETEYRDLDKIDFKVVVKQQLLQSYPDLLTLYGQIIDVIHTERIFDNKIIFSVISRRILLNAHSLWKQKEPVVVDLNNNLGFWDQTSAAALC